MSHIFPRTEVTEIKRKISDLILTCNVNPKYKDSSVFFSVERQVFGYLKYVVPSVIILLIFYAIEVSNILTVGFVILFCGTLVSILTCTARKESVHLFVPVGLQVVVAEARVMHFQREYEYPLYKRSVPEELQLVPKGVFGHHPNVYLQPKYHNQQNDYELKLVKASGEGAAFGEYYYQKDLHGWDKNCSCGILTSEYRNPIEYQQPIIPRQVHIKTYQSPYSSQNNVCAGGMSSHSRTSTDDFPLWLKIYSRASVECDHKLHWHMFNIRDLYFFDNVLVRLYELDLEEIILWYKSYKNALLREMDKRLLKANQQRQRILLYKNP